MTPLKQQCGSTLLVALIMLVLLTLIAVSAINSTSSSIQMVGNDQFSKEAGAAAQQAIENVISNTNFMSATPAPQNIDVNGDGVADYTVTFAAPNCTSVQSVNVGDPGVPSVCASSIGAVCYWTGWDVSATVRDVKTGASVVVHQGIRTIAGLNAAVASCGI